MFTVRAVLSLFTCAVWGLNAQTSAAPAPRFDVASLRLNKRLACAGPWDFAVSHGTVTARNAPLLRIVSRAWNVTDDRVKGPSWLDSTCYDIAAKVSPANAPDADLMIMLQALLRDRLHLQAQLESETRPVFALLPDKGGVHMPHEGAAVPAAPPVTEGKILFMAKTLHDLCERLGKVTGRPVLDETGLQGKFIIVLSYTPYDSASIDADTPRADIFSAVRDQLGLRLEPKQAPVQILKIEGIEKLPAAN